MFVRLAGQSPAIVGKDCDDSNENIHPGMTELHINAWDCAAGILLVTEAGGRANDFFTPEGIHSGGLLVASTLGIYDDLSGLMTD